jgi:hypothetical protein
MSQTVKYCVLGERGNINTEIIPVHTPTEEKTDICKSSFCNKLVTIYRYLSAYYKRDCGKKRRVIEGLFKRLLLFELQMGLPGGSSTTIGHSTQMCIPHKITQNTQTKHNTQSYTNNKGHITRIEYNTRK